MVSVFTLDPASSNVVIFGSRPGSGAVYFGLDFKNIHEATCQSSDYETYDLLLLFLLVLEGGVHMMVTNERTVFWVDTPFTDGRNKHQNA